MSPAPGSPRPSVSDVAPSVVAIGAAGIVVTVTGSGFVSSSQLVIRGTGRPTTFVSETLLTTTLGDDDVAAAGSVPMVVVTPAPGGGRSRERSIYVVDDALALTPAVAGVQLGGTVSFLATAAPTGVAAVSWRVSGVPGGSVDLGTISGTGVYTAPSTIPSDSVVISAVLASDTTTVRHATLFFRPPGALADFWMARPRVLDETNPTGIRLLVLPPANTARVRLTSATGSDAVLQAIGAGMFTTVISSSTVLATYRSGALHSHIGFLDEYDAGGTVRRRLNAFLNVRDGGTAAVAITPIGPDAQRSPHLLNLRVDEATANPDQAIVSRALQTLGSDAVDFVVVIASVTSVNNRGYFSVRNDVAGIGLPAFNHSAGWGGSPRLQGVITFPVDHLFDGAVRGMCHEIGHRWVNFATVEPLRIGVPHWRPSSMASGVMGFGIPGSGAGGVFRWRLAPVDASTVRAVEATAVERQLFDPLDLYLMGLLPADSVPTRWILPAEVSPDAMATGALYSATPFTATEYIAQHGVRVPSSATSQREFVVATVILSVGRLLTASEMAFFDHAAARLETRTTVPAQTGFDSDDAIGCYQATGGRATFSAVLP